MTPTPAGIAGALSEEERAVFLMGASDAPSCRFDVEIERALIERGLVEERTFLGLTPLGREVAQELQKRD